MKNYLLCVGGTGTRVLRAVLYGCASGIIQEDEINVMVIDADQESMAWKHVKQDWEKYKYMHSIFRGSRENTARCFRTNIRLMSERDVISPVNYNECRTLRDSLCGDRELERIMSWLYTEDEMDKDLKDGFFARPSVGCVFFSHFQNEIFNSFLEELTNCVNQDDKVNVMLVGSIFGGTGASGMPTILKLIDKHVRDKGAPFERKAISNLNIGAIFMLPYFSAEKDRTVDDPMIEMEEFNIVAKEALRYYQEGKYFIADRNRWSASFQSLYLVEQDELNLVNIYAEGGEKQDNKPHIAEECAALAVHDFFYKARTEQQERGNTNIFSHKIEKDVRWSDLPCAVSETQFLERKMGEMARFATVYCTEVYGYINARLKGKKQNVLNIPQWYIVYVQKNTTSEVEQINNAVYEYCRFYLEWICMMQMNMEVDTDGEKIYDYNEGMQLFGEVIVKLKDFYGRRRC